MKNYPVLILLIAILSNSLWTSCSSGTKNSEENAEVAKEPTQEEIIIRGEYLVTIMGCNDCHSPKKPGAHGPEIIPELLLSGYPSDRPIEKFEDPRLKAGFGMFYPDLTAAAGPWGVSFAANLTPDDSGIGTWNEEQFKIALTQGKYKGMEGSRPLLPPMPWFNYTVLTDDDIHAIFTYLKSINPVRNVVPQPIPPDQM